MRHVLTILVAVAAIAAGGLAAAPAAQANHFGPGYAECYDGHDNDFDTFTDWHDPGYSYPAPADPDCVDKFDTSEASSSPPPPPPPPGPVSNGFQCGDLVNNDDGDTFVDYPADPGCYSPTDNDEGNVAACGNGNDDDGDGRADSAMQPAYGWPTDPGCDSPWDTSELDAPAPPPANVTEAIYVEGDENDPCVEGQPCSTQRTPAFHWCVAKLSPTTYGLIDYQSPNGGAVVTGLATITCNVPMPNIRMCGQLWRNTYTGSPSFVGKGTLQCTQRTGASGFVWSVGYVCTLYGSAPHSRTWYVQLNTQVTFPSGRTQTQQWKSKRRTHECH